VHHDLLGCVAGHEAGCPTMDIIIAPGVPGHPAPMRAGIRFDLVGRPGSSRTFGVKPRPSSPKTSSGNRREIGPDGKARRAR